MAEQPIAWKQKVGKYSITGAEITSDAICESIFSLFY